MKKKIIWIGIVLITATITVTAVIMGGRAVSVETANVIRGDIEEYIEEIGVLALEEESQIFSTEAGKVTKVLKKAGEEVKAGEVILRLDNSDLLLQIKAMEAQKLSISAKYEEAKKPVEEEIKKLKAQVLSAQIYYEDAKRQADNNKALYEAGAVSLDTYKASVAKLAAAEADLEAAKSGLALAEKGISENVRKQYEAQLSEIQARIDQLKLKIDESAVKSPIDGYIMSLDVEEGSVVQPGIKICEVGGNKGLYIESYVLVEDMEGIKTGTSVRIDDEDLGISNITGKVRKIHPKAESIVSDLGIEQKRVKVEIELDNPIEGMRPGYDMTVKIITSSKKDTLLIDEEAVFTYEGKDHVFVNEGGVAKLRAIEKGLESNGQVEVLKGLKEGEQVILSPDKDIKDGAKIKKEK